MQVQGSQKFPNEWQGECQLACKNKYTCIDKFKSESVHQKLCREYEHTKHARKA